jgi:hypothetical protein
MKYVISRFNQNVDWVKKYTDDFVIYDRSEEPVEGAIIVPNIGSDIYDKFTYIIDNYDNLSDVVLLTKANLFKYIKEDEFQRVKDNTTFTPLLTFSHETYMPICYYEDGLYHEVNNRWFLSSHPAERADELYKVLQLGMEYIPFAPGSNYIVPKENILQHPKEHYEYLRSFLDYDVYPGEAQIMERGLYILWKSAH